MLHAEKSTLVCNFDSVSFNKHLKISILGGGGGGRGGKKVMPQGVRRVSLTGDILFLI